MISNIASFLFGASETVSQSADLRCTLHTTPAEDEWVLVDTPDAYCDGISEESQSYINRGEMESAMECIDPNSPSKTNNFSPVCSPPRPLGLSRAESTSSLDSNWQITLPCFTNAGMSAPSEVNHTENLLIEHASMSVYDSLPTSYTRQQPDSSTDELSNEREAVVAAVATGAARACSSNNGRYNLRRVESRRVRREKKESRKALKRKNQSLQIQQRASNRSSPMMVFQPRK